MVPKCSHDDGNKMRGYSHGFACEGKSGNKSVSVNVIKMFAHYILLISLVQVYARSAVSLFCLSFVFVVVVVVVIVIAVLVAERKFLRP